MKANFFFLAATLCVLSSLFAQAPAIQWQNTIGGNGHDELKSIKPTADGGYILSGFSDSDLSGDKTENRLGFGGDYWVLKLDSMGAIQWQNTIGGTDDDQISTIQQTTDGGYILGGISFSNISGDKTENNLGGGDYWVLKLNASGVIQWQNTIGGNDADFLFALQQTSDGGYILGGSSYSDISGDKTEKSIGQLDYWVLKLNATGAIQWQNTIGGNGNEFFSTLQQTADGGYILGGISSSNISGDKTENSLGEQDFWVVKLGSTGIIQWQNTIGGNSYEYFNALYQTGDGGYILGGASYSNISGDKTENSLGGEDYWVVKLNTTGAIQWQNTIGGNEDDELTSLQQTADGGYIIGGYSYSNISGDKTENNLGFGSDFWVLKLNSNGAIQWQNTIGGSSSDYLLYSIQQTDDDGYILGGSSASNISGDKTENRLGGLDFWVIKLAPETVPTEEALTAPTGVTIYPNPATDAVFVQVEAETTLSLYNAIGQSLLTQTIRGNDKIDLSSLPRGIYFLVELETGIGHKILKN